MILYMNVDTCNPLTPRQRDRERANLQPSACHWESSLPAYLSGESVVSGD